MAPPPGTLRVGRYFTVLVLLIAALYATVFFTGGKHTPKLGIDLVGGREVILKAIAPHGKPPTTSQMEEAKQIIETRVNGTGVTNATVVIQGDDQLIIDIPGGTNTDVSQLGKPAVLNFRPLITSAQAISCTTGKSAKNGSSGSTGASPSTPSSPSAPAKDSPTGKASGQAADARPLNDAPSSGTSKSGSSTSKSSGTTSKSSGTTSKSSGSVAPTSPSTSPTATPCIKDPFGELIKDKALKITSIPNTEAEYNALIKKNTNAANAIKAALANYDCRASQNEADESSHYYVACDKAGQYAYLLGKVIVPGSQIDSASAQAPTTSGQGGLSEWSVQLNLKNSGADAWATWTANYNTDNKNDGDPTNCGASATYPCATFVGFTLDGQVIEAPATLSSINHQPTSITGNFNQDSASELAQELNYGALPLSFNLQSNNQISATLGTAQLKAGLLAGAIGLILVVLYSLIYYRGLGLVTIASLIVSAGLTYAMLVLLGKQIGFNLDLSGIAGFIVAIGITADSFVVFFERIKDEVHEGRSMRVAVPRAWVRARRTVLSADFVSFLAAAILYFFAAGDVRGFAFTLGLSTILDLIVVFFFTHPMVSLLSRSRAFGSARFTGLNAVRSPGATIAAESSGESDADERDRRRERARARRSRTAVAERSDTATTVETDVEDETDDLDVTPPPAADDVEQDVAESDTVDDAPADEPERPRRRTTPAAGTAAERAAARRARLREKRDDDEGER